MSTFFRPKVNVPDAPPPPPDMNDAARAQDHSDKLRRRRGRQATILVPGTGAAGPGMTGNTVLGG